MTKPKLLLTTALAVGLLAALPFFLRPRLSTPELQAALASTKIDHLSRKMVPAGDAVQEVQRAFDQQHPKLAPLRVASVPWMTHCDGGIHDSLQFPFITCDVHGASALDALEAIAAGGDMRITIRGGIVYVYMPEFNTGAMPPITRPERFARWVDECGDYLAITFDRWLP